MGDRLEVLKRMLELRREPNATEYHTDLEEQQALDYAIRCVEENERLRDQIEEYKETLKVLDPPSDIPLVKKVEELEKANKELKIAEKDWVLATNIMQKKDALIEELERENVVLKKCVGKTAFEVAETAKEAYNRYEDKIEKLKKQLEALQSKQLKPLCRGALREYMYPQFQDREYMLDIMCDYICSTFGTRPLPSIESLIGTISDVHSGNVQEAADIAKAILNKLKG